MTFVLDALLFRFCQRSIEVYGDSAVTSNMHIHCHLAPYLCEFGPLHGFWLFPFERYNGILEGQLTNNQSVEMQLMKRFQNNNFNLQLHHKAQQWPEAIFFGCATKS